MLTRGFWQDDWQCAAVKAFLTFSPGVSPRPQGQPELPSSLPAISVFHMTICHHQINAECVQGTTNRIVLGYLPDSLPNGRIPTVRIAYDHKVQLMLL